MAVFLATFRLKEGSDYTKRWQSVVTRIKSEATGPTWDETTSVIIFKSPKSAAALLNDIRLGSEIRKNEDHLLIINLTQKEYAEFGAQYPATLKSLMDAR